MKIGVLGAGSWGTALAMLLYGNGHQVTVWSWDAFQVEMIRRSRHNEAFLRDLRLPEQIVFTDRLDFLSECDIAVLSVPSHACAEVCERIRPYFPDGRVIVNTAKGFDGQGRRLSVGIKEIFPGNPFVALSGPSHAEEVSKRLPTAIVAAGEDEQANALVQRVFTNDFFRVYTNTDLCGVEIGGAVKNVIALATGISDGMGFGDNAKAAIISRGLAEMVRLGVKLGGKQETFFGLTGIGDLQVTCSSMFSRNRRAGIEIGKGVPVAEVQANMGMVVEGINAVRHTYALSQRYGVYMPITAVLYRIIYEQLSPAQAFEFVMSGRPAGEEIKFR